MNKALPIEAAGEMTDELLLSVPYDPETVFPDIDTVPGGLRFPLRKIDPDAFDFVVAQKRFVPREVKDMLWLVPGFEAHEFGTNPAAFYTRYFDAIERVPAAAVVFDITACTGLTGQKYARKIERKPAEAMRLANKMGLRRMVEKVYLDGAPMTTELRVALFYEYATREFINLKLEAGLSLEAHILKMLGLSDEDTSPGLPKRPGPQKKETRADGDDTSASSRQDVAERTYPENVLEGERFQPDDGDAKNESQTHTDVDESTWSGSTTPDVAARALEAAQLSVMELTMTSGAQAFASALDALAKAQDAVRRMEDPEAQALRDAACQVLVKLLEIDADDAVLRLGQDREVAQAIRDAGETSDTAHNAAEAARADLVRTRAEIQDALAASDYARVGPLSEQANVLQSDVARAEAAMREAALLVSELAGGPGSDTSAAPDETAAVAEAFSEAGDPDRCGAVSPPPLVHPDGSPPEQTAPMQGEEPERHARTASSEEGASEVVSEDEEATALVEASVDSVDAQPSKPSTTAAEAPLFAELLLNGMPAVAARLAQVMEDAGTNPPLSSPVLRAASVARTLGGDYTSGFNRLLEEMSSASLQESEFDAAMAFGAALSGALFVPESGLRSVVEQLRLGAFGAELQPLKDAIAALPFAVPPGPDALAEMAGATARTRAERLAERLLSWTQDAQNMTGPCQPVTRFLHAMARPGGFVGDVADAISKGILGTEEKAREVVAICSDLSALETKQRERAQSLGSRNTTRLNPASRDYMRRRFMEVSEIIEGWLAAREAAAGQKFGNDVRRHVMTLKGQLKGAAQALERRIAHNDEHMVLDTALSDWLHAQVLAVRVGLDGNEILQFASEEEAVLTERARFPSAVRRALQSSDAPALLATLHETGIPTPEEAVRIAVEDGAFATAMRLLRSLGDTSEVEHLHSMASEHQRFAAALRDRLQALTKRVAILRRLDLDAERQESMPAREEWLHHMLALLDELSSGDGSPTDLDGISTQCHDLEILCGEAEADVRADQLDRVTNKLPNAKPEDRAHLQGRIEDGELLEAIENGIALLRDGRALAAPMRDEGGLMQAFVDDVLPAVEDEAWPDTAAGYEAAFADDAHPLAIARVRRDAAAQLMSVVCGLRAEAQKQSPKVSAVAQALEELGFRDVKIEGGRRMQGARPQAWSMTLHADVTPTPAKSWFLPPMFGTAAARRYQLVFAGEGVLPQAVAEALSEDTPAIVLIAGVLLKPRRHEFTEKLRLARRPAVLIDEAVVAFAAGQRASRLETVFSCGLPYGFVEPYVTNAGNLPQEMFFGRDEEIRLITSLDYEGCLVFGGRQLGKSALLNHVRETTHDVDNGRIVVLRTVTSLGQPDTPASTIWRILHAELESVPGIVQRSGLGDAEATMRDIQTWLTREPTRRILALLDETDEFMSSESANGFPEITRLKELMEKTGRRFKVVFAGVHNVQRLHKVTNSPLAHFRRPIVVGPMNRTHEDKRAARDLVVRPLRAAGYRFADPAAIDQVLAYTNEYPSLVQEFLQGLLRQLNRVAFRSDGLDPTGPLWRIPSSMLFEHERFGEIESEIRKKFRWTLDLDVRYALVANVLGQMAHQGMEQSVLMDGIPLRELFDAVQDFWPPALDRMDAAGFGVILDEMYDLGVLGRIQMGKSSVYQYCLRSPQVLHMLGQPEDVENELLNIADSEPAARYDKAVHRLTVDGRMSGEGGGRRQHVPLTVLQIERLMDMDNIAPRVVCGIKLLGLERVGTMLERLNREMAMPGISEGKAVEVVTTDNQSKMRAAVEKKVPTNTVRVVVHHLTGSARDAERILDFLGNFQAILSKKVRPIVLLDAESDGLRDLANRQGDAAVFLAPWGGDFLRMHLHQAEANHLDTPSVREAIMRATGGVPGLVVRAVQRLRSEENPANAAEHLEEVLDKISGLRLTTAMRDALELVVEYPRARDQDAEEHYELLNDLCRDTMGADLATLGPDLKALGLLRTFFPTRKLIEASALGAIVSQNVLT